MNLTPWAWLIVPLGLCRLLQIVLWDRVLRRPRGWLLRKLNPEGLSMHDPDRPYLSYALECVWCMSVWVGSWLVPLLLWDLTRAATLAVLLVLALSLVIVIFDRTVDSVWPDPPSPGPDRPDGDPPDTLDAYGDG